MAYARPDLLARIVDVNARAAIAYLEAQVASGADAVMVFDTWGGLLTADAYRTFSLAPMRAIVHALRDRVPTIVFTRGGGGWLRDIAATGAHCVGLDWTVDMAEARAAVGDRVALQGNLDPVTLLTDPATVTRESARIVRAAGAAPGHVFNLGHGILPTTPPDNVAALVEAVHRTSREIRATA
jgi:uroporphyrinogen decarboxylase